MASTDLASALATTPRSAGSTVTIVHVLPQLLGTYGDGGNALVLAQRLRWRGIPTQVVDVGPGDRLPASADLYVFGGGEDQAQVAAMRELDAAALRRAADGGAVVFGVCAGFQLLGEWFTDGDGQRCAGLGLLDVRSDRIPDRRAVGEVRAEPSYDGVDVLTGFENHRGRTTLGPGVRPLARVVHGIGNGTGGEEGAVAGSVVATYLHGPVLARNPSLADALLRAVLGDLPPLDDTAVGELRERLLAATA